MLGLSEFLKTLDPDDAGQAFVARTASRVVRRPEVKEFRRMVVLADGRGGDDLVAPLLEHFYSVTVLGEILGSPVLYAARDRPEWGRMLRRLQAEQPALSSRSEMDLWASDLNAAVLLKRNIPDAPAKGIGSLSYWQEFHRGWEHYQAHGVLFDSNPYVVLMRRLIEEGNDPGAVHIGKRPEGFHAAILARLMNFSGQAVPALVHEDRPGLVIRTVDGEEVEGAFDGHHRTAAALLRGEKTFPFYRLRSFFRA